MKTSEVSQTGKVRRSKYQIFPPLLADRHEQGNRTTIP